MTVRYVAIPAKSEWYEVRSTDYLARTVVESEPAAPVATGLLDANGVKLYKIEDRNPVGFVHFK